MATIHGIEATHDELRALALTGYGHFTSMHVEEGGVRGFDLHIERLVSNAKSIFDTELDRESLVADIRAAIDGSTGNYTLRVTMFDPRINLGNVGTVASKPVPLITTRPSHEGALPPLRVKTIAFQRDTPEVKHVGLFSPLRHRVCAKKAGFDDVLFTHPISADVSEGSTWNSAARTIDTSRMRSRSIRSVRCRRHSPPTPASAYVRSARSMATSSTRSILRSPSCSRPMQQSRPRGEGGRPFG